MSATATQADPDLWHVVEGSLAEPGRGLKFPAILERRYIADISAANIASLRLLTLCGIGMNTLFAGMDYFDVPDVCHLAWSLRAAALLLAAGFFCAASRYRFSLFTVEIGASLCMQFCLVTVLLIMATSHAANRSAYAADVIAVLWYTTIFLPTRNEVWLPVALVSGLIMLGFIGVIYDSPVARCSRIFTTCLFLGTALFLAYRQEHQRRQSYLLSLRDTFRHKELAVRNEHLRGLAERDELTTLLNRRGVRDMLAGLLDGTATAEPSYGILLLDIDEFKAYNDRYGHIAGDDCLRKVAAAFRSALRESDLTARFGGEEFLAVLPGQDMEGCQRAAAHVRLAIRDLGLPHQARRLGAVPRVTVSIGVACTQPGRYKSFTDLVQQADEQLYLAKQNGRDCVFPRVEEAVR